MKIPILKALYQASVVALLASPILASQDNWDEIAEEIAREDAAKEEVARACAPFQGYEPGPLAEPTEADHQEFAKKNCLHHFYDAEGKIDYGKGRLCCLVNSGCNRELAMVFANGWNVRQDLDTATYFLCRAGNETTPEEQWSMLQFLHDLWTGGKNGVLDYCDHVTSGVGAVWCKGLEFNRKRLEP